MAVLGKANPYCLRVGKNMHSYCQVSKEEFNPKAEMWNMCDKPQTSITGEIVSFFQGSGTWGLDPKGRKTCFCALTLGRYTRWHQVIGVLPHRKR